MVDDPYAELPEVYDLEHEGFRDDLDLYLQLAEVIGDPILEMGSGTGRLVRALAEAGHRVTGLDHSGPMLGRAREIIARDGLAERVILHEGPMTEADHAPGGPFGLVLFSLNGLMHLASAGEQRRALGSAYRALDPRGMLVVDMPSPGPEFLAACDGRVVHEGFWERADGARVDRFASRTCGLADQRIETEIWFDIVGPDQMLRRVRTRFPMRFLYKSEVELLLESTGFVEWHIYGSYDLDPYHDGSDRLIVTAEVTPSARTSL